MTGPYIVIDRVLLIAVERVFGRRSVVRIAQTEQEGVVVASEATLLAELCGAAGVTYL